MIRVGIVGFGNLGKGVFQQIKNFDDLKLVCIFTKRNLALFQNIDAKFDNFKNIKNYKNKIDVMIMCGGSLKDLPADSPEVLKNFCIIDSFDTHAKIFEHFKKLNKVGEQNGHLALLSAGWDPGLFSMMRLLFESISNNSPTTFWGKGVSEGHSDAIRKIEGVLDARAQTLPNKKLQKLVRRGFVKKMLPTHLHKRECFVAVKEGTDKRKIEKEIKSIPNYFEGYETKVHFVSEKTLKQKHQKLFHAGNVFGVVKDEKEFSLMEFSLKLHSNPIFTASVLLCFVRAVFKMNKMGRVGAITVFDVPLCLLSSHTQNFLLKNII